MKRDASIERLPWAVKDGKHFRIPGRVGQWKYFNGRSRPTAMKTNQMYHLIARVKTGKGRVLVREFIKVRKYQVADDGLVLDLLRSGRVRVDGAGRVFSRIERSDQIEWRELSQYENKDGGYLFVRLYRGNERKKVAVHKLIVMADIDSEIPAGFDVDHRNKNHRDNRLANLRLLASETNRCTNLNEEPF